MKYSPKYFHSALPKLELKVLLDFVLEEADAAGGVQIMFM